MCCGIKTITNGQALANTQASQTISPKPEQKVTPFIPQKISPPINAETKRQLILNQQMARAGKIEQ